MPTTIPGVLPLPTGSNLMDGASVVLLEQIKTIDKRRVVRYIGRVNRKQMDGVNEALQISLGLYIPEEMEAP